MAHPDIGADVTVLPSGFRDFIRRRLRELTGVIFLAILAAIAISLASWTITDPSLNHAVNRSAQNYLGPPGAVIADLALQAMGVAAAALLLAPLLWTLSLIRHVPAGITPRKLLAWSATGISTAGLMSLLPHPESWPLPTGMGGIIGDGLSAAIIWVFALFARNHNLAAICASLACLTAAIWFGYLSLRQTSLSPAGNPASAPPRTSRIPIDEPRDSLAQSGNELAMRGLGAIAHMRLASRAWLRRAVIKACTPFIRIARLVCDPFARLPGRSFARGAGAGPATRPGMFRRLAAMLAAPSEPQITDDRIEPHFDIGMASPHPGEAMPSPDQQIPGPDQDDQPARAAIGPAPQQIKAARGRAVAAKNYTLPPVALLTAAKSRKANPEHSPKALSQNAQILEGVLDDFGIRGEIINVRPGPVVTLYELEPAPGIKSSRVIGLADDIARSMSAISARVAVVPGRNVIGIELPNKTREIVYLRELLTSQDFAEIDSGLPLALGKDIGGGAVMADLARMPHLLIAGTTGSGKSVGINTMVLSLLYRLPPDQCKLIMIDPKMLELSVYDGIPHLLTPVVTDPKKAVVALKWTVREMEERYQKMSKIGVRNIDGFNERIADAKASGEILTRTVQTGFDHDTGQPVYEHEQMDLEPMPYIVVIVDEMADLMMVAGKEIEGAVQRLAQMARAAGIHMITATQRPSVDVITGTIKANFPTRISFQVTSKIDSRTILGEQGAEQLLGQGDMLFMAGGGRISRVHGPFVSDAEVEKIVKHLKKQGMPEYLEAITAEDDSADGFDLADAGGSGDELYDQAVAIVATDKKASTSYIQRRLSIGYNRAATIIERMEEQGVVGPANHAGKREIFIGEPGEGVNA